MPHAARPTPLVVLLVAQTLLGGCLSELPGIAGDAEGCVPVQTVEWTEPGIYGALARAENGGRLDVVERRVNASLPFHNATLESRWGDHGLMGVTWWSDGARGDGVPLTVSPAAPGKEGAYRVEAAAPTGVVDRGFRGAFDRFADAVGVANGTRRDRMFDGFLANETLHGSGASDPPKKEATTATYHVAVAGDLRLNALFKNLTRAHAPGETPASGPGNVTLTFPGWEFHFGLRVRETALPMRDAEDARLRLVVDGRDRAVVPNVAVPEERVDDDLMPAVGYVREGFRRAGLEAPTFDAVSGHTGFPDGCT